LLAKAVDQLASLLVSDRFREQARPHRESVAKLDFKSSRKYCGSELARDGVIPFTSVPLPTAKNLRSVCQAFAIYFRI
jgi:hypothetical protein